MTPGSPAKHLLLDPGSAWASSGLWSPGCGPHPWPWSAPQGGATSDAPPPRMTGRSGHASAEGWGGGQLGWGSPSPGRGSPNPLRWQLPAAAHHPPWHQRGLTFEQGQRRELLLVALVAELRGAMGPPGPGPAEGPAGEAIHLVGRRHRGQPRGGGAGGGTGRGQLRLHDSQAAARPARTPGLLLALEGAGGGLAD